VITKEQAQRVKLLALDVDGVLTDNGIWVAPIEGDRVEFKRFDIQDGLGLVLLRGSGIDVAWVSGRHSESTALRARELCIATVIQDGGARKFPAMEKLLDEKGLAWEEVAYVGDDIADLPVLRRAGLPIAVANGCQEVRDAAAFVTGASGGHGAVREVIVTLLKARGGWDDALHRYLKDRGDPAA
jgi:3-deoxy-D-manno-octulosonate 8-phosphate phosphatase (KDO 8-P phosphatase)